MARVQESRSWVDLRLWIEVPKLSLIRDSHHKMHRSNYANYELITSQVLLKSLQEIFNYSLIHLSKVYEMIQATQVTQDSNSIHPFKVHK